MSAVGPELPPHLLAKRKRLLEESSQDADTAVSGAKRRRSPSPALGRRQIGPAPPPASLDERPGGRPDESKDSSSSEEEDDEFGPSLPGQHRPGERTEGAQRSAQPETHHTEEKAPPASRRDEWMMVPPKQDDLAARLDPSKPRAKGFNTGKSARGGANTGASADTWTETPDQKRQRLENQVMGVKTPTIGPEAPVKDGKAATDDDGKASRIKESRGQSLYNMHQGRKDKVEDDDPSKRVFDREKDIGRGTIGGKQKRELLNRAADFGTKFSSGSYL